MQGEQSANWHITTKSTLESAEMKADHRNKAILAFVVLFFAVGLSLLIAALVKKNACNGKTEMQTNNPDLKSFIKKVQKAYYAMNPNKIVYMPDVTVAHIRQEFSAYDARPSAIKKRTDKARSLYAEVKAMQFNKKTMAHRERKALAQVKHYLQSNFGSPYDENYYAGDWMMGPNYFCWQPICSIGSDLGGHFNTKTYGFQPVKFEDVVFVINAIEKHGQSVTQYVANIKYGVKAGMVRSVEDCKSGLNSIKARFPNIAKASKTGSYDFLLPLLQSCIQLSTFLQT